MARIYRMRKHAATATHPAVTAVAINVDGVRVQVWNFEEIIQAPRRCRILGLWFTADWSIRVFKHGKSKSTLAGPTIVAITCHRGKKQINIPQSVIRQGVRHSIRLEYVH